MGAFNGVPGKRLTVSKGCVVKAYKQHLDKELGVVSEDEGENSIFKSIDELIMEGENKKGAFSKYRVRC